MLPLTGIQFHCIHNHHMIPHNSQNGSILGIKYQRPDRNSQSHTVICFSLEAKQFRLLKKSKTGVGQAFFECKVSALVTPQVPKLPDTDGGTSGRRRPEAREVNAEKGR